MRKLEKLLASNLDINIGLLILRLSIGILILFHGFSKINHGIEELQTSLVEASLPKILALGVYIGEIIVPIFIIIGLFTRISSILLLLTMLFTIYIVYWNKILMLNEFGTPVIESTLFYLFTSIVLLFTGAGKYSFDYKKPKEPQESLEHVLQHH